MKRRSSLMFVFTFIFLLLLPASSSASWIKLSPAQLEQRAEIILVGYIEGATGEYRYADDIWDTEWKVNVRYYLKGNISDKYLTVYTPGVKNYRVGRSTDFELNERGNLVLLFLEKKDKRYFPITPQGIIGLKSNRYSKEVLDPPTGVTVLKEYSIKDGQLTQEEKEQMEEIIKGKTVLASNTTINIPPQKRLHFDDLFYFSSIGISFVATLIFAVLKMRRTKNLWRSFRQALLLNFLLLVIISIAWFFHITSDGFAQVFGLIGYVVTFEITGIITLIILLFLKNHKQSKWGS